MRYPRFFLLGLLTLAAVVAVGVLLAPWSGSRAQPVDSDGDGYDDATEAYLGTDELADCVTVAGTDAWPPDFSQDATITITDMFEVLPPVYGNRQGQPGFVQRADLNADGINGALDVAHLMTPMFGSTCPGPYVPPPAAGSINEIAIDMDTTGNDARLTQGANIQNCGKIDTGVANTIDIDVVLPEPGVHADDGIEVWEFLLNYDPAVVNISAEDKDFLLNQAAGSTIGVPSDALPDAGGSWRSAELDNANPPDPESIGGPHEVGPGVLTRITLTGVAQGTTALTLTKVGVMTAGNGVIPITTVTNAWVSVDEPCVPGTPQFEPTFNFKLCNDLDPDFSGPADLQGGGGTCTPDTTPSGHPDTTLSFAVPQGHMNYAQSYFVATGGAHETRLNGSQIGGPNPDGTGAAAGGLQSRTSLGLIGSPCNNVIFPDFIWWEAEYDITDTVACAPPGWANMATDGGDAWPGQADNDSPAVTQFPDCTLKLFDPDGDGIDTDGDPATIDDQPVQPRARFAGLTQVPPGGDWQMLQNLEFDPGALQAAFLANQNTIDHPYAKLDPSLGFTNVTVLNDPKAVILQQNPISDFCSPITNVGMLKGRIDVNGDTVPDTNRVTSPATPGSYQVQARTQSLRDADGDGLENNFDTCVWTPNTAAESPYVNSGPDGDMLDSACDPAPGVNNDDEDGDGYLNPQDWCPLVAAPLPGGERDSENEELYNDAVPDDGGPQADQIGDGCDDVVRTWRDVFINSTIVAVDDLHLTFFEDPNPAVGRTIFKVISISGGTGPDTWDWQIDGHVANTVAADCASDAADNVVDITGTNGTTVGPGGTLTVVVQPCAPEEITTLSVTAQWTSGGVPVGAPFVVVNVPKYSASSTVSDGLYFNAIHIDSVCITDYDAQNLEDGDNLPDQGPPNECDDGIDNDADTLIDSGDADCSDGMVDADSDGWCDDFDPADADTYHTLASEDVPPGGPCNDGTDNGWDGLTDRYDDDCNFNAGDPGQMMTTLMDSVAGDPDDDGDGYDSLPEWHLGVDPGNDCPLFVGEHDAWPPDFDMNRVINISDVFRVLPPTFGSSCGQPAYSPRADLVPDCVINISDVFKVLPPTFGLSCTP